MPKPYTWVEQAVVIRALRRIFRMYPPYTAVRYRCRRERYEICKNGNQRKRVDFECETCNIRVSAKDFRVDHTSPVVDPNVGFVDYNTYVRRLFCSVEGLSGMCDPCHKRKCKDEAGIRAKTRKERKQNER